MRRSFAAAPVPGTNLVLVTALNKCPPLEQLDPFSPKPWEVKYHTWDAVHVGAFRKAEQLLPRRRPANCFREHVGERDIPHCGSAPGSLHLQPPALLLLLLLWGSLLYVWR